MPIRQFPAQSKRVESGSIQFGDDWPGIFIRGDEAGYYAMILNFWLKDASPADLTDPTGPEQWAMQDLANLLGRCIQGSAKQVIEDTKNEKT